MYTPKGEVNEKLLAVLGQERVMEEWKSCRTKEEILFAAKRYVKGIDYEELLESLTVIEAYLEEEQQKQVLLSEEMLDQVAGGMRVSPVSAREEILRLMEARPGISKDLQGMFRKLQIM